MEQRAAHVAEAKRHVAEGEQRVADQRVLIVDLERDGHDTTSARELLTMLETSLALMHGHLQRLLDEQAGDDTCRAGATPGRASTGGSFGSRPLYL